MTAQRYQQLNPLAFAAAAGCTALVTALLAGFPMMGFGGMMGGYGRDAGAMWGYHGGYAFFGLGFLIGGALLAALVGAVFAWIYNAVNVRAVVKSDAAEQRTAGTDVSAAR